MNPEGERGRRGRAWVGGGGGNAPGGPGASGQREADSRGSQKAQPPPQEAPLVGEGRVEGGALDLGAAGSLGRGQTNHGTRAPCFASSNALVQQQDLPN